MNKLIDFLKLVFLSFGIISFISFLGLNLINIERSDILSIRYCPSCGIELRK